MTRDARKALQKQQAELIRTLQGRIDVPAGLDESKVAAAVQSLLRKRGNEIKAAWPTLADYLGKRFRNLYSIFAASQTTPQSDPVIDGYLFAVWLSSRERLPAEVIVAVRRFESQCSGKPRVWWQPDCRKVMIVWRWRGRAHSAILG